MNENTVIFIVGATSSGKTAVSVELARRLKGEIISCDSMQIYRDMDVITQAPDEEMAKNIPHHLIRYISPEEEYNAARFQEEAKQVVNDIMSRKSVPVVVGGTGLYMKALIDGIFPAPPKDEELREELRKESQEKGRIYLYEKLKGIDRETANKLHPNDIKRVIRALEVYELTGETMHDKKRETEGTGSRYDCRIFGMELNRSTLYECINRAVDRMFDEGLVEEVKGLKQRRLSKTAGEALGIKEITAFLEGAIGFDEARKELKKNTRRYAKRQLTWFRADKRVEWIDAHQNVLTITEDIIRRLNG